MQVTDSFCCQTQILLIIVPGHELVAICGQETFTPVVLTMFVTGPLTVLENLLATVWQSERELLAAPCVNCGSIINPKR